MSSPPQEPIDFRPGLDMEAAAAEFAVRGRVRIADFLEPSAAARLYRCLSTDVPWRTTYNEGMESNTIEEAEFWRLDPQARSALMETIVTRARDSFQYLYQSYPMVKAYLNGEHPGLFLHRVLEWLNHPDTLEVMRKITGINDLIKINAQATLYRPGNFLKQHDDIGTSREGRRVAYVLSMTHGWRADWGGQLQFLDDDGEVEEIWLPRFNSLALFSVPMPHVVSYVAPFARQPRFAVTGWLCDA